MILNSHSPLYRTRFFLTGLILFLFACHEKPLPLSIDKMSLILTEIHIAEAYAQSLPKDSQTRETKNTDSLKKFYAAIFHENKTTEIAFKQSVDWYKSRPDQFDSIYQQVLTNVAIWQTRINKK